MDLNIRNVDASLIASLKSEAALSGKTLRVLCLEKLNGIIRGDSGDQGKGDAGDSGGRRTDGDAVPVLPKAAKPKIGLHPVPAVRVELVGRGGHEQEPSSQPGTIFIKCEKPGHRNIRVGERWLCLTCREMK
jgi:hypothetical protein